MSDNKYYKENMFKRGLQKFTDLFKKVPTMKFDAVAGAIGFFVILVAMLEYKVFESMYTMTGDIILTASTLLITAFGGVYAEVVLRRNEKATDDQNMYADWIFYVSLITSAFIGLGAWMKAIGITFIDLSSFGEISVAVITLVTIFDILTLRAYFRGDVGAVHRRNLAASESKKVQADFQIADKLIDFEAEVKGSTERILIIAARRKEIREELSSLYGGRVPDDVMKAAMDKLDLIMEEEKTGKDINGDGHIGLPTLRPAFGSTTKSVQLDNDPKDTGQNGQKPPQ